MPKFEGKRGTKTILGIGSTENQSLDFGNRRTKPINSWKQGIGTP